MDSVAIKTTNPLYQGLKGQGLLPNYHDIQPEDFEPALLQALADAYIDIKKIANLKEPASFVNTIEALERAPAIYNHFQSIFGQLLMLRRVPELEMTEKVIMPLDAKFWNMVYGHTRLGQRVKQLYKKSQKQSLPLEEQALLNKTYKRFEDNGAYLPREKRLRVQAIDKKFADLGSAYDSLMNKFVDDSALVVSDKKHLKGIPADAIAAARKEAKKRGYKTEWVFTGDDQTWLAVVYNAQSRDLRKALYKTPAIDLLQATMTEMVGLRAQRARLMGFKTHVDYKIKDSMIDNKNDLLNVLHHFRDLVKPAVWHESRDIAKTGHDDGIAHLARYDHLYYQQKLRQDLLGFRDETLRPYIKVTDVVSTCFQKLGALFNLDFIPRAALDTWHTDVTAYDVHDRTTGEKKATLALDLFSRPLKNDAAFCQAITSHGDFHGEKIIPFVVVTCNMARAADPTKSTALHYDAVTFFHEMGHAVHAMLGVTKYQSLSGFNNVGLDFIEFPSQILENFAYEPDVIDGFAKHPVTGAALPQKIKENIQLSRAFLGGSNMRFALELTYLDLMLHSNTLKKKDIHTFEVEALAGLFAGRSRQYAIAPFFQHIATYGYDAGYHAYIWTEALEAQAYQALNLNEKGAEPRILKLRDVYKAACLVEPKVLFEELVGSAPDMSYLIDRYALVGPSKVFHHAALPVIRPKKDCIPIVVPDRLLQQDSPNQDFFLERAIN